MELQWLRYLCEVRQTAGLALFFGTMAILSACIGIAEVTDIGQKWAGNSLTFPPIALLLANLTQALFGLTNIGVGLAWLVSGKGSVTWSFFSMVVTYAAWFPFLTVISLISFTGDNYPQAPQPFIPMTLEPTTTDVNAVTTLAALGFIAYGANLVGALTFCATKLFRAHSVAGVTAYTRAYYASRQTYYGFLTVLAGVVQLALGAYVQDKFGSDRLLEPIAAGPFTVTYSQASIAMGVLVTLQGGLLMARSFMSRDSKVATGVAFDWWSVFVYVTVLAVQVLTQVAVAPTPAAGRASTVFETLALAVFPVYLDIKSRSAPEAFPSDFYSLTEAGPAKSMEEHMPSA